MKYSIAFIFIVLFSLVSFAQDKTTGGVRGKVRSATGDSITGVTVEARKEDKTVETARTDKKGEFKIVGLKPGIYRFVFNKSGLTEGISQPVEIKADTVLTLKRLILSVDQGTLAVIRGSVFDPNGRSVNGAKVEVSRISNNDTKKIAERFTSETGEFLFRLPSDNARYRFKVTIDGAETVTKDYDVDSGAQIYRFSITLKPAK